MGGRPVLQTCNYLHSRNIKSPIKHYSKLNPINNGIQYYSCVCLKSEDRARHPRQLGKVPGAVDPQMNTAVTKVLVQAGEILGEKAPDDVTANVK